MTMAGLRDLSGVIARVIEEQLHINQCMRVHEPLAHVQDKDAI